MSSSSKLEVRLGRLLILGNFKLPELPDVSNFVAGPLVKLWFADTLSLGDGESLAGGDASLLLARAPTGIELPGVDWVFALARSGRALTVVPTDLDASLPAKIRRRKIRDHTILIYCNLSLWNSAVHKRKKKSAQSIMC